MEGGLNSAIFQDQREGQEMTLTLNLGHSAAKIECNAGFFLLIDGEDVAPDGRQWAFQSTNDPRAHAASIRLLSSPQQCIRDVIVQVSSKQPPHRERTEAGITQSSDRHPTVGRMYMGT